MKQANIAKIKNELSRFLRYVKNGETVRILERDQPIAEIVPLVKRRTRKDDESLLTELESKGIIRCGTGKIAPELLEPPEADPDHPEGYGLVEALLEERRSGW